MMHPEQDLQSDFSPGQISERLKQHPDLLVKHPELLTWLSIPHPTHAGVSSLLERTIPQQQREYAQQQQALETLHQRLDKLHQLQQLNHKTLMNLFAADEAKSVLACLLGYMRQQHGAQQVRLFMFMQQRIHLSADNIEILGQHDKLHSMFTELFNRAQPLIDSLQSEHLQILFARKDMPADKIHSTLLIPLVDKHWEGLLALGSYQYDRYCRDAEFDLICHATRVAVKALEQKLQ